MTSSRDGPADVPPPSAAAGAPTPIGASTTTSLHHRIVTIRRLPRIQSGAMAESPSPYAPGIIGDQPAAPRPPARPSLFLTAAFVMTVVASGNVFSEWAESRKVGGGDRM